MAKKKKKERSFSSFLNNSVDFALLVSVFLLLSIGLIMVLSASSPSALSESGNSYQYFSKQLLFAVLGLIAMAFISKIDYRFYQKFYKWGIIFSVLLLILVMIVGREINGAKRWIYVTETLSLQPSEIVKFLMIIFYAGFLTKNRDYLQKFGKGFLFCLLPLAPIAALLLAQPHFSALIVIGGICCVMMIMAGCKLWHFLITGIVARNTSNYNFDNKSILSFRKSSNFSKSMEICIR